MSAPGTPTLPPAGSTALVVGLGRSGAALARFLDRRGVHVRVCDTRERADLEAALGELPAAADLRLGGYDRSVLIGCAAVYASPGVRWDGYLLEAARAAGIPVSSEIELFFQHCPGEIVGITGTNGKTTTTALAGAVLARGERPVVVAGNIGVAALERLPEITERHWVVLELSSFQLESIERPRVSIGAVLNITPDHLDRHGSLDRYVDLKARLVETMEPGDAALLNGLDAMSRTLARRTRAEVIWFDRHVPVPPMPIPGRHNLQNALAAAAIGRRAGIPDADIDAAVAAFPGVEHRLELVGEWDGVRWYNDSKATNPDAGRVGLGAFEGTPVVLIAGGDGHFDLSEWALDVRRRARSVVVVGLDPSRVMGALAGHPDLAVAAGIEEAVEVAAGRARPGSVVLLSPAHKSYDQFRSFEERGCRFKAAVLRSRAPS
ncbi:MAG: UDP-N-acetylmuramoyl-L-alanine--D-glutamate ligase [Candidatus Dormibacteraceae bacterium]